jgi:hypothetical protein
VPHLLLLPPHAPRPIAMKAYIGSSRINGNPLANFEETSPRIPLQKFEPVSKVADGEVVSAQAFGEFAPREGRDTDARGNARAEYGATAVALRLLRK